MKVVVFGASGMVGHGVLLEALDAADVHEVVIIVRRPFSVQHPKLREVVHQDFTDFSTLPAGTFDDVDACFYCLGVSSAGMQEPEYRRVSYDFPLAAAKALWPRNRDVVFTFVTGVGTDSTGVGKVMWARVKGQAENALLELMPTSWMFRPGGIIAERGVVSATPWLRRTYVVLSPLLHVLKAVAPRLVTTTSTIGQAMLQAVRLRPTLRRLEVKDFELLATGVAPT